MLLRLLRFVFGYIKAEVCGFAPERFMNLIVKNDVVVWDVEHTDKGYIFYTGRKNLMLMKPYLQRTNMKLKILEKKGLPFIFKQHKRRVAFVAGFTVAGIFLYIMSLFVWEINVTGEDKLVAENVLKTIEEKYVSLGTLKSRINCQTLEADLRKEFDEISWVSCELKGTGLTVFLEEGMAPKKKEEALPGDLVAAKDAVIIKMITRQGTPIAKMKDTVKKGDTLISGTIYLYDDNNEILETSYISADGDVYGQVTEQYEDYVDLKYYKKIYDEEQSYLSFFVLDYSLTPYVPKMKEREYDTYTQMHKLCILNHFYLPIGYKRITRAPYQLKLNEYSEEEAKTVLKNRLSKKMKEIQKKGVAIIKNDVTIVKENERVVAKGSLTLNEPIAVLQPFTTPKK